MAGEWSGVVFRSIAHQKLSVTYARLAVCVGFYAVRSGKVFVMWKYVNVCLPICLLNWCSYGVIISIYVYIPFTIGISAFAIEIRNSIFPHQSPIRYVKRFLNYGFYCMMIIALIPIGIKNIIVSSIYSKHCSIISRYHSQFYLHTISHTSVKNFK